MTDLDFIALDVETADSTYPESICQIGLAVFKKGEIVENFALTVHTHHKLAWWQRENLQLRDQEILAAPKFRDVMISIEQYMTGPICSHTPYDKFSVARACAIVGHDFPRSVWLDSAQIVRRAWPDRYGKSGYGLKNVAAHLGIQFTHHDAGEDARAVALIVLHACNERQLGIDGWLSRVTQPISGLPSKSMALRRDGNVDGPLFGEVVVLTGGFDLKKAEQADLAAFAGCDVADGVTKKTTMVVVGDARFVLGERSGKWKRAEELVRQGARIRIISESDFRALIADQS